MSALRLPYYELSADAVAGLRAVKTALDKGPLDQTIIELVNLRISQINGCAYCLDMHAKSLRKGGESDARLDTLAGWRASRHFTDRERAALAWAEAVTDIADTHAPDSVYRPLKEHFSEAEISDLTIAVTLMNAFNRLAVAMGQ
jgi:AhpD family alkylhydroperoxidase